MWLASQAERLNDVLASHLPQQRLTPQRQFAAAREKTIPGQLAEFPSTLMQPPPTAELPLYCSQYRERVASAYMPNPQLEPCFVPPPTVEAFHEGWAHTPPLNPRMPRGSYQIRAVEMNFAATMDPRPQKLSRQLQCGRRRGCQCGHCDSLTRGVFVSSRDFY